MLMCTSSNPYCTAGDLDTELSFDVCLAPDSEHDITGRNLAAARGIARQAFDFLGSQCQEEEQQYARSGQTPPLYKQNQWKLYREQERARHISSAVEFIRCYPECHTRVLAHPQIRFLMLVQHFVSADTADVFRPEDARRHSDTFEGFLTESSVNSQLVKDAHRSEWTIDGKSFSLQNPQHEQDRRQAISTFQRELIVELEQFLLSYCQRHSISPLGTQQLLRVITTQMSQCGLANLDRSSRASQYYVSGQGLEQRTAYSVSVMDAGHLGEALKLTFFCMKTGFVQYHTEETLSIASYSMQPDGGPVRCAPSSYLYQYATIQFTVDHCAPGDCERVECAVLDALDEVHIDLSHAPTIDTGTGSSQAPLVVVRAANLGAGCSSIACTGPADNHDTGNTSQEVPSAGFIPAVVAAAAAAASAVSSTVAEPAVGSERAAAA